MHAKQNYPRKDMKLIQSGVVFHPKQHIYVNEEGTILSGITSILKRHLFADKYGGIPSHILAKAAERGAYIHEQLQNLDEFEMADEIEEVENYKKLKQKHGIKVLANEYLVSDNERYATQVDMVDECLNLYDYKTTATLDADYLSWQLSLNAYLFELQNATLKVGKLYVIWLRGDICELREVQRQPVDEVAKLLACDKAEVLYVWEKPKVHESAEVRNLIDVEEVIAQIEEGLKEAKAKREQMIEAIKQSMESNGQKSLETDRVKITLTKPSTRSSVDSARLKSEMPEVYEQFCTSKEVASSVRVTIKKQKINK